VDGNPFCCWLRFLLVRLASDIFSVRSEIAAVKNDMAEKISGGFPRREKHHKRTPSDEIHIKELKTDEELWVGISPLATILKISDLDRQE